MNVIELITMKLTTVAVTNETNQQTFHVKLATGSYN